MSNKKKEKTKIENDTQQAEDAADATTQDTQAVDTAEETTAEGEEAAVEEKPLTKEEELTAQLNSQKEQYLRLAAEYDNYRKRTQNEKLMIYDDATAKAVEQILPIADSIAMALASMQDKDVPEEFLKGVELIGNQLKSSFDKMQIESFGAPGDVFDPSLHNAVSKIEDENLGENTVSAVYQTGYKIKDKIIRHAMVVVANCD